MQEPLDPLYQSLIDYWLDGRPLTIIRVEPLWEDHLSLSLRLRLESGERRLVKALKPTADRDWRLLG